MTIESKDEKTHPSQERRMGYPTGYSSEVVVRAARAEDVPGMMALERAAETAAHWREVEYLRLFDGDGGARVALVAEHDADLAGFIVTADVDGEWELENIVVGQDWRGRGIGSRLMEEFVEGARRRGGRTVFLEVRESNAAARRLYRSWGFEESGRRKGYYSGPEEDGVLYTLKL